MVTLYVIECRVSKMKATSKADESTKVVVFFHSVNVESQQADMPTLTMKGATTKFVLP